MGCPTFAFVVVLCAQMSELSFFSLHFVFLSKFILQSFHLDVVGQAFRKKRSSGDFTSLLCI